MSLVYSLSHAVTSETNPNPFKERPSFLQWTVLLVWTQKPLPRRRWAIGPGARRAPPYSKSACSNFGNDPNPLRERPAFLQGTVLLVWTLNPYLADAGPLGPGPEGPHPTVRAHAVTSGTNPNPLRERPAFPAATGLLVWTQNLYLADAGPLGPGPEGPHPKVRTHAVTWGTTLKP